MFPSLREYRESDMPHLASMEVEYYREVDPNDEFSVDKFCDELADAANSPKHKLIIAHVGDEIAGYIWLEEYEEDGGRLGYISNIHVAKPYRGKGIGKFLLSRGEEYFKAKGITRTQLEVAECNKPALELYIKNGYKLTRYHYDKNEYTPAGEYLEKSLT